MSDEKKFDESKIYSSRDGRSSSDRSSIRSRGNIATLCRRAIIALCVAVGCIWLIQQADAFTLEVEKAVYSDTAEQAEKYARATTKKEKIEALKLLNKNGVCCGTAKFVFYKEETIKTIYVKGFVIEISRSVTFTTKAPVLNDGGLLTKYI